MPLDAKALRAIKDKYTYMTRNEYWQVIVAELAAKPDITIKNDVWRQKLIEHNWYHSLEDVVSYKGVSLRILIDTFQFIITAFFPRKDTLRKTYWRDKTRTSIRTKAESNKGVDDLYEKMAAAHKRYLGLCKRQEEMDKPLQKAVDDFVEQAVKAT
jgi:hypothetical protein